MRVFGGISAERSVVRGVLLPDSTDRQRDSPALEYPIQDEPVDTVTLRVLDALEREAPELGDVAVVYRSATERRATVSALAGGKWQRASHVSIKAALLALAREAAGTGNLMVLELLDNHTAFVLVGPGRTRIFAADSWPIGVVGAHSTQEAIERIRPISDASGVRPDAILICGAVANDAAVADAVRLGFATPVAIAPDAANAVARGAALVAAEQLRELDADAPEGNRRAGRVLLGAAAVAATLAAVGVTVVQIREHSTPVAQVHLEPAGTGNAMPTTTETPVPEPIATIPSPDSATDVPAPIATAPPRHARPAPTTDSAATGTVDPTTTIDPATIDPTTANGLATPTTVGAPDANWLFPGESPPPPAGSDPALVQAWWDNHLMLKERWLHGN
ncbi:hypothetical protein ACFVUS_00670 [Nocardia sp. NPDC058058]|uniref:hypothetical protein n=1 Tax=Nocardia sp. NPDC058058 TaxID=3346317 RepID=UPI0036DC9B0E